MSERFVLNETSIFGRGCRNELPGEIKLRGFEKVLLVTDKGLVDCKLINKVSDLLDENQMKDVEKALHISFGFSDEY